MMRQSDRTSPVILALFLSKPIEGYTKQIESPLNLLVRK